MKKSMFITVVAMMFGVASFAQKPAMDEVVKPEMPSVEQIAKWKADRLREQLLLGQDQYDKVYKMCLKQAKSEVARMKERKAEQEKMSADMKDILNDAQYERYEQMQKAPRNPRPGNGMKPGVMPRFDGKPGRPMGGPDCGGFNGPKPGCDKGGKCDAPKACCDKNGKCDAQKSEAPTELKVKQSEPVEKYEMKKGERIRFPVDRRGNQNAYVYIDEAAE